MDRTAELRRAVGAAAVVWLASHLGYLAMTLVSRMGDPGWIGLRSALRTWLQSDTNWYLIIAADGYGSFPDDRVAAFFPLYPMLIRVVDPVLPGGGPVAAFVVFCALSGVVYIVKAHGESRLGPNWFTTPKVLLTLAVWIVYAVVLHSPINPSFRGRKVAFLSILGCLLMVGTLVAVQLVPGVK